MIKFESQFRSLNQLFGITLLFVDGIIIYLKNVIDESNLDLFRQISARVLCGNHV